MDPTISQAMLISGLSMTIAMLVTELDNRGALSKESFIGVMRKAADDAEKAANSSTVPQPRVDLALIRQIANLIEHGPSAPQPSPPPWTPTVVEGGKS